MCRPAKCSSCNKVTWAGCGAHVAQVMAGVRPEERCRCRDAAGDNSPQASTRRRLF